MISQDISIYMPIAKFLSCKNLQLKARQNTTLNFFLKMQIYVCLLHSGAAANGCYSSSAVFTILKMYKRTNYLDFLLIKIR